MDKYIEYNEEDINYLKAELQQQRAMLWMLGEMEKASYGVSSFKELMSRLSDMMMGVMGLTSCYLWIKTSESRVDEYTVFFRSVEYHNQFIEKTHTSMPATIRSLQQTKVFGKEDIRASLMKKIEKPNSRLVLPLFNFNTGEKFGMLVAEHDIEQFFSKNTVAFFETLSIFISSKAQYATQLQMINEQSIKDPLTGSYNRRHLNNMIEEMLKKHDHVTVAISDTDNFKTINDELGHIEGDIVLKGIAKLAQGIVKECDGAVVRYGGDEFVILIPEEKEKALQMLESFRIGTGYLTVAYDLKTKVSVTLGVCSYPEIVTECGEALIRAADNALLRGKSKGKNRIVVATGEDMS